VEVVNWLCKIGILDLMDLGSLLVQDFLIRSTQMKLIWFLQNNSPKMALILSVCIIYQEVTDLFFLITSFSNFAICKDTLSKMV
jgi:hypothetical protein